MLNRINNFSLEDREASRPTSGHPEAPNNFRKWTRLLANEHVVKILKKIYAHSFLNKHKALGLKEQEILALWDASQLEAEKANRPGYLSSMQIQKLGADGLIDPMYAQFSWHERSQQWGCSFNFHQGSSEFHKQIANWLGVEHRFVEMV